jgi:predicted DNA-binding transcriptional regulator AlpA
MAKPVATQNYAPRGLRAERAADYLGMSKSKFLELVGDGRMPQPTHIDGMVIWDRVDLDDAFDDLKRQNESVNTFDAILGARAE